MRFRLIKPDWGKSGAIGGPNVIEGDNFSVDYLKQQNDAGFNVYYFPNHNSKKIDHPFLRGSDIDTYRYAFVDMDLKDGRYESCEEFLELLLQDDFLPPSKVIFSGNGLHAYWEMLDLTLESYLELQLRLIQKYKTDESIWTALQLMRLPGFYNTKQQDNYKFVKEEIIHDRVYEVEELKALLPDLTTESKRKLDMHLRKLSGIEELEALDEDATDIPEKFIELLEKSKKIQQLWGADKGERSEADFHLACILYDKEYSKPEALAVLLNTSKALSKGPHRKSYAVSVVTAAYMDKAKFIVKSAGEKLRDGSVKNRERGIKIYGPSYFDCMNHGWRTSEMLGLVGSSGVGKTTVTLDIFHHIIKNNPEDDGIFVLFSLEMEDYKIIEQWQEMTAADPHLSERFFVVSNEDEEGNSRHLNLQDIHAYVKDISKVTGKKVRAVGIDHIGIINKSIDIKRKPDFGLAKRDDLGFGTNRTLTDREMTKFLKGLAKELDCFMIVQSQTTKEKAGEGDVQLGLGAAYGVAQFEWDMDYVMTIWQPLKRVRYKTDLAVTAFQYCKNRYVHKEDKLKVYDPAVLYLDLNNGNFRELSEEEFEEFKELNREATVLRKMAEKKEGAVYRNAADLTRLKELFAKKRHLHEVGKVQSN